LMDGCYKPLWKYKTHALSIYVHGYEL